jgi:steroid delta-isomerase
VSAAELIANKTETRYRSAMIESEFVTWEAPDSDHPVRRLSQRSYDLVSRKQKEEWLTLFAEDGIIEDPVGPSFFDAEGKGHRGLEAISAFWDMAIAPVKEFHFTIRDSFANGNACANIGTFSTTLEDGTLADTDLIAVYRVDDEGKLVSMAAHWELERTMATLRKPGLD